MTIARVALSAVASGANGFTTTGVDTTGANLLIIALASYTAGATVSDSKSNTYTALTQYGGSGYWSRIWYCLSPTVGTGHTVTVAGGSTFDAGCFIAYSGVSALDTSTGSGSTAGAQQPGNITPAGANELFVTASACVGSAADYPAGSIDSGFTVIGHQAFTSGTCNAFGVAELIETTATAKNPLWSPSPNGTGTSATMAAFTASAGGGGGITVLASAGSLHVRGKIGVVLAPRTVHATAGSLHLRGQVGVVHAGASSIAVAGSVHVRGQAGHVATTANVKVLANAGSLHVRGTQPVVKAPRAVAATAGSIHLRGTTPFVHVGNDKVVNAVAGSLHVRGQIGVVTHSSNALVRASAGSLHIRGSVGTVVAGQHLICNATAGLLRITGRQARAFVLASKIPATRTAIVAAETRSASVPAEYRTAVVQIQRRAASVR